MAWLAFDLGLAIGGFGLLALFRMLLDALHVRPARQTEANGSFGANSALAEAMQPE